MDISLDTIHWQQVGNDLMPLYPPKDMNYPLPEILVASGVVYGYNNQYTGTGQIVPAPVAPRLLVADDSTGGTATFTVSGAESGTINTLWVAPYSTSLLVNWTQVGSISENGSVSLSVGKGFFAGKVISTKGGGSSQNLSNLFYVTCPYNLTRVRIRDGVANSVWQLAQRIGFQCTYQEPGGSAITLWALQEDTAETATMFGGETGTLTGTINIPRQVDFPPTHGIVPGGRIGINGVWFGFDCRYPTETYDLAPVFTFYLRRLDITVEIDGTDV